MKILSLLGLLLLSPFLAFGQSEVVFKSFGTSATNVLTATTNATAGTIIKIDPPASGARIYLSANGVANAAAIGLTVKFSTASGSVSVTNNFDTADTSNIKLSMTNALTSTTSTVSDWFVLTGVKYIRVGAIENGYGASVSNISVNISYPK